MTIVTLAWRNVWRNKKRSILSFSSVACSCIVITLLFGLITAMSEDLETNLKTHVSGDIRVRNKQFQEHEHLNPLPYFVPNRNEIRSVIENIDGVTVVFPRIVLPVVLLQDSQEGFVIEGVDLTRNEKFRDFSSLLIEGNSLAEGFEDSLEGVIAEGLARKLQVGVGDTITALSGTVYRSSNAMTFTIVGIAWFSSPEINQTRLIVPISHAERLSMMTGGATELLINVENEKNIDQVTGLVTSSLDPMLFEVQKWDEVSSTSVMLNFAAFTYTIIAFVFFLLGSVAIVNTVVMSIFERKLEIGLLGSLGMRTKKIRNIFFLESIFISVIGSCIGLLLGVIMIMVLSITGLNLGGQMQGMSFEFGNVLYPRPNLVVILGLFLYSLSVSALATYIPTRKIVNMQPVDALREE